MSLIIVSTVIIVIIARERDRKLRCEAALRSAIVRVSSVAESSSIKRLHIAAKPTQRHTRSLSQSSIPK